MRDANETNGQALEAARLALAFELLQGFVVFVSSATPVLTDTCLDEDGRERLQKIGRCLVSAGYKLQWIARRKRT